MQQFDNIEQGSQEWHDLRAKYTRTASRTPVVLGLSPFSKVDKLAQEIKFGIKPYYSAAMRQGNDLEEMVRELANEALKDEFIPTVGVNGEYLASLDGINLDQDTIIEIKVSEKTYTDIENNKIPDYYLAQIHHQMMVFETVKTAFLVAYNPKINKLIFSKPITRNETFQRHVDRIKTAWSEFDEFIASYELPEADKIDDTKSLSLAKELFEISEKKKLLDAREKEIKEILSQELVSDKTVIGNLIISKQKGAKKIDYVKLINDKQVDVSDIDSYTTFNKESVVFRFSK